MIRYREQPAEVPGAKWVSSVNMHITMVFLGGVASGRIDGLHLSFAAAAAEIESGEVRVEGIGGFPRLSRASVFWAGVVDEKGILTQLAEALRAVISGQGLSVDDKPFIPHLTLARFKRPADLREVAPLPPGAPWHVDAVGMFSSRPGDGAPIYERISSYPLASRT